MTRLFRAGRFYHVGCERSPSSSAMVHRNMKLPHTSQSPRALAGRWLGWLPYRWHLLGLAWLCYALLHGARSDAATGGTSGSSGTGGATGLFRDGMFVIGVYGPRMSAESFLRWKCFGINTVVDIPDAYPAVDSEVETFDSLAKQVGLYQIRQPFMGGSPPGTVAQIQRDAGNLSLLALSHIDEPNNFCGTAQPPSSLCAEYAVWKAALPGVPVYTGFSGGDIVGSLGPTKYTSTRFPSRRRWWRYRRYHRLQGLSPSCSWPEWEYSSCAEGARRHRPSPRLVGES